MKLKQIIKMLLPYLVGIVLFTAVVIFVLLQLSAASYLVLLVCINVVVVWIWLKSNSDANRTYRMWDNNTNEFFDRMAEAESDIREIKEKLNIRDDE